MPPGA